MRKAVLVDNGLQDSSTIATGCFRIQKRYARLADVLLGSEVLIYRTHFYPTAGYYAVATIGAISAEPNGDTHYQLDLEQFRPLDQLVPIRVDGAAFEDTFDMPWSSTRTLRTIPEDKFNRILDLGGVKPDPVRSSTSGFEADHVPFLRDRETHDRPVRNPTHRRKTQRAYDFRCALSGLRFVTSNGQLCEADVCHIRAVALDGLDVVTNAIMAMKTLHWFFDQFVISVSNDYRILGVERLPPAIAGLIVADRRLVLPARQEHWPDPAFLSFHRAKFLEHRG